uniref:Olfactory receptor 52B2-like n=1 Tax=Petromyzon marinus TaxID=7757 RepID=A0AAJ7XJ19_PETMA|nr:olfactory receptor 52B2-like [Petromyzon marinus]
MGGANKSIERFGQSHIVELLRQARLRWLRHVDRMPSHRMPKQLFVRPYKRGRSKGAGYVAVVARLRFCRARVVPSSTCDFSAVRRLMCGEVGYEAPVVYANILLGTALPLGAVAASYVLILRECRGQRLPGGRRRALSTCVTHLLLVLVYFTSIFFTFATGLRLGAAMSGEGVTALQTVQFILPPALNPVIYGLRTAEVRRGLARLLPSKIWPSN